MRWAVVRYLVQSAWFPRIIQWPLLVAMISLIVLAWGAYTPDGINDKLYAKSHLATLLIWGLWWPLMIWGAVGLGRVWCMICPLEMVNNFGERLAQRSGWPARSLPRWLAGGSMILALYFVVMMLVPAISLHRVPAYTAWYLTAMLAGAAVAGAWYRDRAYCRGFCPVGLLLGTFGRGGIIAVRPGLKAAVGESPGPDARSCPSLLNPSQLADNADCLVCTQCIKQAGSGSMQLLARWPFPAADARESLAAWKLRGRSPRRWCRLRLRC